MGLQRYRSMRDFAKTSEPAGARVARSAERARSFVIQKHAASHLHYDFRLELGGVLLSWSVPKGPSLDPEVKRLAMQTEDHPVEYGKFEGTIPKGEYGGGTVMLWDRGTWTPEGDAHEDYRKGRLTFVLRGERLRGRFHLVRTSRGDERPSWLLFKGSDEEAKPGDAAGVVERESTSVKTGRSMEEIAAGARASKKASKKASKVAREQPKPTTVKAPAMAKRGRSITAKAARSRPAAKVAREPGASKPKAKSTVEQALKHQHSNGASELQLSNPDKVLWPEQGVTKLELAQYYLAVAAAMLPHVARRPLTLVRCPEGRHKHCFFQKHATEGMPAAIRPIPIREKDGKTPYTMIEDAEGLLALVQLGVLEIHTWGAHADRPERPDLLVMDIDPDPELPFSEVIDTAVLLRAVLDELGLQSFVKTTGGKGLHVCLPLERRHEWDEVKEFTRQLAELLVRTAPERYITTISKQQRKGKIFVDYLRNGRGATFIAPFSTRSRPGAPVAFPIPWEALRGDFDPQRFNVKTVPSLLAGRRSDPWANIGEVRQSITAAMKRRVGMK